MLTSEINIVAIGGTLRENSTSANAMRLCLLAAERMGAHTHLFTGEDLQIPLYDPNGTALDERADKMIAALRKADGVIIASPGYHGSLSGVVKNALDYTQEMSKDSRPYFDGRAVGCVVSAGGWQAAGTTLVALRSIVHALRGWPTPIGVMLNSQEHAFDENGRCNAPQIEAALEGMVTQILEFAQGAISKKHLEEVS